MKLASSKFFAVLMLAAATSATASASIIFTNFGPSFGYDITAGNPVGNAFDGSSYAAGGTFRPVTAANLGSISIAVACAAFCPPPDSFTVALAEDAGDKPGLAIETFTVSGILARPLGTNNAVIVLGSVSHPLLSASTQYWVTVNSDLNDSLAWNLNSTGDASDEAISTDAGATWFSPSENTPGAFEVDSAASSVPEPATALLLLGGSAMLYLIRRRAAGL